MSRASWSARVSAFTLTLASLLTAAGPARATPQDLFGFGTRSPGLAMTGVSFSDDYESAFVNPAGAARARRRGIHLGLQAAAFDLQLDGARFPMDSARGMTIGATLPLPFGDVLKDRLGIAIGVYTPQQVLLRGQIYYPEVVQWPVLSRAQSLAVQVGLGVDLHDTALDGVRVGAGISALANVLGDLDVRLDETNRFVSTVETQLLASFSPIAGVMYQRGAWDAGLVYRHESRSEMNLIIRTADLPVSLPVLTVGGLVQYDAPQLAGELSFRPAPDVRLIGNLTARFWSAYPGPTRPTSASSLLAPAPGFADTVSPRIAVEGTLRGPRVSLALRAGYAFEPTASPPARIAQRRMGDGSLATAMGESLQVPLRYLDNDRHVLTAGLGFAYDIAPSQRLRIDAFGQMHALLDRTHEISASGDPLDEDRAMQTGGLIMVGGWTFALEY